MQELTFFTRSCQNEKFYTPPNKKLFQTKLKLRAAHLTRAYSKRAENNMRKGENTAYFSCTVFKWLLPHFRENLGLCGKCVVYKM